MYILQYFPSINFNILSAEIFPWPLILAMYRYALRGVVNLWIVILISFMILHLYLFSVYKDVSINSESLRVASAYINGPVIFWLIITDTRVAERLRKLIQPIFIILISVGLLQYTNYFNMLTPFMKLLVERGLFEQFGGGRGVTIFATEPSRAGVELIFIYTFLSSYVYCSRLKPAFDILFMVYLILCIKSFTAVVFFIIVLSVRYPLTVIFVLILSFLHGLKTQIGDGGRAIQLLTNVLESGSLSSMLGLLISQSGFRFISVYSVYTYLPHNLSGGIIGNWPETSLKAILNTGFNTDQITYFKYNHDSKFVGVRPTSYLANLILDFGIYAIFLLGIIFGFSKKIFLIKKDLLLIFLFSFIAVGSVGNPIPWLVLALSINVESANTEKIFET